MTFIPPQLETTFSASFPDNGTLDLPVGTTAAPGAYFLDVSIRDQATGAVDAYEITAAISDAGAAPGNPKVVPGSDPVTTVDPTVVNVGSSVVLRLTGSGPGNTIEVRYRVRFIPAT